MPNYFEQIHSLELALIPKFTSTAALALLIYDLVLTFDQELQSIWKGKWNTGKTLFVLNRYVPLFVACFALAAEVMAAPQVSFCTPWYYIESFSSIFIVTIAQIIMTLRTYAIYHQNKIVLAVLGTLCFSGFTVMMSIAAIFTPRLFYHDNPLIQWVGTDGVVGLGCLKDCTNCSNLLRVFWTPPMIFDVVVFALTFASAFRYSKSSEQAPLLFVLFRDGFIYFVVISALSLANFMVWITGPNRPDVEMFLPILRAMLSVLCSRLMLNIRASASTKDKHRPTALRLGSGNGGRGTQASFLGAPSAFSTRFPGSAPPTPLSTRSQTLSLPLPPPTPSATGAPPVSPKAESVKSLISIFPPPPTPPSPNSPVELAYMTSLNTMTSIRLGPKYKTSGWRLKRKDSNISGGGGVGRTTPTEPSIPLVYMNATGAAMASTGRLNPPPSPSASSGSCPPSTWPSDAETLRDLVAHAATRRVSIAMEYLTAPLSPLSPSR